VAKQQESGRPAPATDITYVRALFGALGWGVVAFALQVVFGGGGGSTGLLIQTGWILIAVVLAAWPTWYAARQRNWPELWKLFLLAAPAFWVLRIVTLILDRLLFH
jgi:hypothetical protein